MNCAIARFCLFLAAALVCSADAEAARRAFVVGVNVYDSLPADKQLQKAVNDARAVGGALKALDFQVTALENPRRGEFNRGWQTFLSSVAPGDVVTLFVAGHGVQVGGMNFLLPRDVPALSAGQENLLRDESLSLQRLLDDLKARAPRLSLIIIDACRNNPFETAGGRSIGGQRGLSRVEAPEGTFVMFSAGAGETALDRMPGSDQEPTSVFTRRLVPLLQMRDLTLQRLATRVREDVRTLAATANHKQTPAYWDELTGPDVCLAGPCRDLPSVPVSTDVKGSGMASGGTVTGSTPTPQAPAPPKPMPRGPIAESMHDGIRMTVEQAGMQGAAFNIVFKLANTKGQPVTLALDGDNRRPDNQFMSYALSFVTARGEICTVDGARGLQVLDLSDARRFGAQGFDKDKVDRAMTAVGAGESVSMIASFQGCGRGEAGGSGRLMFKLHTAEGQRLRKIEVASPEFAVSR
jgi:Caspase domain